jgi:hypothetical protein
VVFLCGAVRADGVNISGRLVDEDAHPLAGYQLSFEKIDARKEGVTLRKEELFGVTKSDAQGKFCIQLSEEAQDCSLIVKNPKGVVVAGIAHVTHPKDFGDIIVKRPRSLKGVLHFPQIEKKGEQRERKVAEKTEEKAEEKAADAQAKDGQVKEKPAVYPATTVTLSLRQKPTSHHHRVTVCSVTSSTDGTFCVDALTPGTYDITVSNSEYHSVVKCYVHDAGSESLSVDMQLRGSVSGIIRSESGKPLSKVEVALAKKRAISDATGYYHIEGVPAGSHDIEICTDGYTIKDSTEVELASSEAKQWDIIASVTGTVVVRLTSLPQGQAPPEKLHIDLDGYEGSDEYYWEDAPLKEGCYTYANIAPGKYSFTLTTKGLPQYREEVEVFTEQKSSVDIAIDKSYSISGRIMMDGIACADAWLSLEAEEEGPCGDASVHSRNDGFFSLEGVLPGTYTLSVGHDDAYAYEQKIVVEDRSLSEVAITLERGCRITGVIVDAEGNPIEGADVDARLVTSDDSYGYHNGESKKDGSFVISGVERDRFVLLISHDSYEPKKVEVTVTSDYHFEEPLVLASGFQISGRVVDEAGVAVASLSVLLSSENYIDDDHFSRQVDTDTSGAFLLRGIPRGKYHMEIDSDDYCHIFRELRVESDQNILEPFVMRRGLSIAGVVLASTGMPMTRGTLSLEGPEGSAHENGIYRGCELSPDGSFVIYGLREGVYGVDFSDDSTNLLSERVRAGSHNLILTLPAQEMLLGRVVNEKGEPIPHASIEVMRNSPDTYEMFSDYDGENVESDEEGEFSVEMQQGREYRIIASKSPYLPASVIVTGGNREALSQGGITVTLTQGVTLQGFVREGGAPVAGIIVQAAQKVFEISPNDDSEDTEESQMITDMDGSFTLQGLPLGVVEVELFYKRKDGDAFSSPVATNMVNTRDTRSVEFELPATGSLRLNLKGASDEYMVFLVSTKERGLYSLGDKEGDTLIFEHVIPGDYICILTSRTGEESNKAIRRVVTVKAHEITEYTIDMDEVAAGNSITGTVRYGSTLLTSGEIRFVPYLEPYSDREDFLKTGMTKRRRASLTSEGIFEIDGVEPGRYQYMVSGVTVGSSSHQYFTGEVEIRENQREVALVVRGAKIFGVVEEEGSLTPVPGAVISLVPIDDKRGLWSIESYTARSDEKGCFTFYGIPVGEYTMTVQHERQGGDSRRVSIQGDRSDIHIALSNGVRLSGAVLNRAGAPLAGATLLLCNAQGSLDEVSTGEDGRFFFPNALKRDSYTLYTSTAGHALSAVPFTLYEDHTQEVRLVPGGDAHIVLSSRSGSVAGLQITICDETGRPVSRVVGAVSPWLRPSFSISRTTTKGECRVVGFAPGRYTVGIEGRDVTEKMTITALETTEITIPLD